MSDRSGLKAAAERGITLGQIGHRIVLENDHVRIWEVRLAPGETIDFHIHYHPYLIVSLGGGANEIETIFGDKIMVQEPLGSTVLHQRNAPGAPADKPVERDLSFTSGRIEAHRLAGR